MEKQPRKKSVEVAKKAALAAVVGMAAYGALKMETQPAESNASEPTDQEKIQTYQPKQQELNPDTVAQFNAPGTIESSESQKNPEINHTSESADFQIQQSPDTTPVIHEPYRNAESILSEPVSKPVEHTALETTAPTMIEVGPQDLETDLKPMLNKVLEGQAVLKNVSVESAMNGFKMCASVVIAKDTKLGFSGVMTIENNVFVVNDIQMVEGNAFLKTMAKAFIPARVKKTMKLLMEKLQQQAADAHLGNDPQFSIQNGHIKIAAK